MPLTTARADELRPLSRADNGPSAAHARQSLSWRIEEPASALGDLARVWAGSAITNPFVAPDLVRVMAAAAGEERPVVAIGSDARGAPVAAWLLRLGPARTLRFLTTGFSDQSTALAAPDVSELALGDGFAFAVKESAARRVELMNIPEWGRTLGAVREALRTLGWPSRAFPAWRCPVLSVTPGATAGRALRESIDAHKRLRGYANAMSREPGYAFEVIEDSAALDDWCAEFCERHRERWNPTDTPSRYSDPASAALLRAALGAWAADGLLIRFAIRLAGRRVALAACLRTGSRLIYYQVVTSPAAERNRAGHVLIRLITLWMSEREFDTLDFGAGAEEYKYRYANVDEPLWRVFAASHPLSGTFMRGAVEARIRRSPALQRRWHQVTSGRQAKTLRMIFMRVRRLLSRVATAHRSATG